MLISVECSNCTNGEGSSLKMVSGMTEVHKSVIGYANIQWAAMLVFESIPILSPINVYPKYKTDWKIFIINRVSGTFVMNVARKHVTQSPKNRILGIVKTDTKMLICVLRALTVPSLKVLPWKMPPGMSKMRK